MKVFIVEYEHKHGTDTWAAKTKELAEESIRAMQRNWYREMSNESDPQEMTLEEALSDWTTFSGHTEYFRINEVTLIEDINQVRSSKV